LKLLILLRKSKTQHIYNNRLLSNEVRAQYVNFSLVAPS